MHDRVDRPQFGQRLRRTHIFPPGKGAEDRTRCQAGVGAPELRQAGALDININGLRLVAGIGEDDGEAAFRVMPQEIARQDLAALGHHHRGRCDPVKDPAIRQMDEIARARVGGFALEVDLIADRRLGDLPFAEGGKAGRAEAAGEPIQTPPRRAARRPGMERNRRNQPLTSCRRLGLPP